MAGRSLCLSQCHLQSHIASELQIVYELACLIPNSFAVPASTVAGGCCWMSLIWPRTPCFKPSSRHLTTTNWSWQTHRQPPTQCVASHSTKTFGCLPHKIPTAGSSKGSESSCPRRSYPVFNRWSSESYRKRSGWKLWPSCSSTWVRVSGSLQL